MSGVNAMAYSPDGTDLEPDLLKSALLNIAEALGDRLGSAALTAHQDRLTVLLSNSNPLSIVDLMTSLLNAEPKFKSEPISLWQKNCRCEISV